MNFSKINFKKILYILIILFLNLIATCVLCSKVFAAEIYYLTQNDINNFLTAYEGFYSVNLKDFDLGNKKYFGCGIYQSAVDDRYKLFLYKGVSTKTVGDGSSKFTLEEVSGNGAFDIYELKNNVWTSTTSKLSNTTGSIYGNTLFISDNIAVISTSNHIYFKYSLTNSVISNQLNDVVQQINIINNNYTILNEQVSVINDKVSNLENENASVSEKIDTVIDNQQKINNNIKDFNNDFNNFADSNTSGLDNSGTSAITNTDKFHIDDPTENIFNTVFDGITNILLNDSVEEITVNVMDNQYKIKSNFFVIPNNPLKTMLIAYWSFQTVYTIYKDIRKHIEMAKTLDFFDKCNKDIKADML